MTAPEAATTIQESLNQACLLTKTSLKFEEVPISDGGEGFLDTLEHLWLRKESSKNMGGNDMEAAG